MKCGVYLLKFDSGKTYLGSTNDLDRRIIQHTQGLVRSSAKLGRFLGASPSRGKPQLWFEP
ncbi:MAG: GIY-YIG nuclease family protein [Verrucomicrobia bacterium]|nr:GIY-YIG nuclease family protein [Verrucomicrobiota bacterium]